MLKGKSETSLISIFITCVYDLLLKCSAVVCDRTERYNALDIHIYHMCL